MNIKQCETFAKVIRQSVGKEKRKSTTRGGHAVAQVAAVGTSEAAQALVERLPRMPSGT
jgi:hypothetical protein